jgi:hypothetical protein
MTDPTAHWSPSEVDDDGARASYPPPPALDLDAIEARYAIAACEVGDSDSWRSAQDVPDLVARVRELEAQLAATEAEARTALDALHARCDAAEAETAAAETLAARLGDLLRATADALKGPPPPLGTHSTHDLPEVAWGVRASLDALRDVVRDAAASVGVPVGAPENTAKRLASAVSLARREAERLRAEVAAAQPVLLLDAVRRDPPPDDIAFPEPERHPVTASRIDHRTAPRFAEAFDGDAPPHRLGVTIPPTDDELSDEAAPWIVTAPHSAGYAVRVINAEDARRYRDTARGVHVWHLWDERTGCPAPRPAPASAGIAAGERFAAEHPYAAGAMHGGIAHRSEVSK